MAVYQKTLLILWSVICDLTQLLKTILNRETASSEHGFVEKLRKRWSSCWQRKKYLTDFPNFRSHLNFMKNMPQCLKSCQYFISDKGGSSAFTPPIMLFARPVTLQPIVPVTWSFVPLTGATLYHIWRGLAEPLSSLHLPLNTLFVCVSPCEWTIVPRPKGTETKSLVFQFPWCLISPCDKFMRFNCTMVF